MPVNLQITYRDFPPPALAEERIREKLDRLCKLHPRIIGCHVVAEAPHHHHKKGRLYRIGIDLTLPGGELVVNKNQNDRHGREDFFVALRDAFQAIERQLRRLTARRDGDIKSHEVPPHGIVRRLFPDHGFIESADGEEIYFHANSVANGAFDRLDEGQEVRFVAVENESEKGPQATTVIPIGKHHLR